MHVALLNPQGNFDPQDSHWTAHPDFGGQLVYVKHLALELGRLGCQVDILTRQIVDPNWPEFADRFDRYPNAPNVRIVRLPAGPPHFLPKEELWPYLPTEWVPHILAFYQEEGGLPDVFSAHYGDGGIAAVLLSEQTRRPFTFTAHSLGAQKMDRLGVTRDNIALLDKRYHFARRLVAERLSMNRAARVVVSTRQERFEQYGHRAYRGAIDVSDDERFVVIPPGVDTHLFRPQVDPAKDLAIQQDIEQRLARDIQETRRQLPAILMSARLDPKKNHVGLARAYAFSPLLQQRANLVFITAGAPDPLHTDEGLTPDEQNVVRAIREVIERHRLWGRVSAFSLKGQPALAAAYRYFRARRSVFVLPSLYEPFGLAPLEAAACGLPVVVTQNGGPREVFREGRESYGLLCNPDRPEDIADKIERLLADPALWAHYARRAQERVWSRFRWHHTAKQYLAIFRHIHASSVREVPSPYLPIHPYFQAPSPATDVTVSELVHLYFDVAAEEGATPKK